MALDFTVRDVIHTITAKFTRAFLPNAQKPYNLRAVFQPELDIHGIASKAEVYNITTSPKVIEEGMTAGMELIYYLAADGFKIKTPLFNLRIRLPGEYEGDETHLPNGVFPEGRLQITAAFQKYLKETIRILFDGTDTDDGFIAEAVDEATGLSEQVVTMDNLVAIHGTGLKVDAGPEYAAQAGLFFEAPDGARVKAKALAVNEPRHLKAIAPASLAAGTAYRLVVVTQTSVSGGGTLLKNLREVKSEFTLTAQAESQRAAV
ncbi:MAG: DUF4469 domain-containing protein [Treponematales bacterium]